MLFKTLKKMVEKQGLTAELREKIDLLYSLGRLTEAEYLELVG
ncbi:MAG: hypothetical protein Q4C53_08080 [Clostridia bacterium]|nr:hypothetical protein [Clostridia bacterium]